MRAFLVASLLLVTLVASYLGSISPAAADPGFGLATGSPSLGVILAGADDVLNPAFGTPMGPPALLAPQPPPMIAIPSAPALNYDAISFGNDPAAAPTGVYVVFSVDNGAGGEPGGVGPADVFFNTGLGGGDGAAADVYTVTPMGGGIAPIPAAVPAIPCGLPGRFGNHILIDANGLYPPGIPYPIFNTPNIGLVEPFGAPGTPGRDNIDSLDLSDPSLVAPMIPGPPTAGPVFFSVDLATLAALGPPVPPFATPNSPADIFVTGGTFPPGITRFADAASLGLAAAGNNIDALAIGYVSGAATFPLGLSADTIVFSLAPGSVALAGLPTHCVLPGAMGGDLFGKGAALGVASGPALPMAYLSAEELGLCTTRSPGPACVAVPGDNVDEIDIVAAPPGPPVDMDADLRADPVDTDDDADGVGDFNDNCPGVPNAPQTNTDAAAIDNGPNMAGDDPTVPNSDGLGDACDPDDDNDGLSDVVEAAALPCASATGATSSLLRDSDGDHRRDGAECALGTDPATSDSAACGGVADPDNDCLPTTFEAGTTLTNSAIRDTDVDGIHDGAEYYGWGIDGTMLGGDVDTDACLDYVEVGSINADTSADFFDFVAMALGVFGINPPNPAQDADLDINADNSTDFFDFIDEAKIVFINPAVPAC